MEEGRGGVWGRRREERKERPTQKAEREQYKAWKTAMEVVLY